MITFGLPWALAAGGALAAAAVLLHLLAPRPPGRAPLPTARFLREDARMRLRPRRRPSDVGVLALRMLLALLLGVLFARPRWTPEPAEGVTRIVLLDRGTGLGDRFAEAVALAFDEAEAGSGPGLVVPFDAAAGEPVRAEEPEGRAAVAAAGPATAESSYLVALRALRGAALEAAGTENVEAVLVGRPRWSAWDVQLGALRAAAWPGAIRVVEVGAVGVAPGARREAEGGGAAGAEAPEGGATAQEAGTGARGEAQDAPVAALPRHRESHPRAVAALEALGYRVAAGEGPEGASGTAAGEGPVAGEPSAAPPAAAASEGAAARLRFVPSGAPDLDDALARAAAGDTVVVFGAAKPGDAGSPVPGRLWDAEGWPSAPRAPRMLRVGGRALDAGAGVRRATGAAAGEPPARRLPLAWEDGAPAAAALAHGNGCLVRFGAPLETAAADPGYPALLRALADGCRHGGHGGIGAAPAALDRAAALLLRGEGPDRVAVGALGVPLGRSLEAWVLLAAALIAVAESWRVASVRRRRGETGAGPSASADGARAAQVPAAYAGASRSGGTPTAGGRP